MNPHKTFAEFIYEIVNEKENNNVFLTDNDSVVHINTNDGLFWTFQFDKETGNLPIEGVTVNYLDNPDNSQLMPVVMQAAWELYTE